MRISIISPYPTVRAGLTALAHEQPGWEVASASGPAALVTGATGADAIPAEPATALDVALIDLEAGFEAEAVAEWVEALRPRSGVVALGAI